MAKEEFGQDKGNAQSDLSEWVKDRIANEGNYVSRVLAGTQDPTDVDGTRVGDSLSAELSRMNHKYNRESMPKRFAKVYDDPDTIRERAVKRIADHADFTLNRRSVPRNLLADYDLAHVREADYREMNWSMEDRHKIDELYKPTPEGKRYNEELNRRGEERDAAMRNLNNQEVADRLQKPAKKVPGKKGIATPGRSAK